MGRARENILMELYRRIEQYFEHIDPRGSIQGLINSGSWREINLISSDAGAVRGRHYHKLTEECFIILSGRILVKFRKPLPGKSDLYAEMIFYAGDVFTVNPLVEHTFEILEKAQWINLLSIPMDSEHSDFYKYSPEY
jgi:mannose-6-phosphate isomerase-like protein (cupin superfamily)